MAANPPQNNGLTFKAATSGPKIGPKAKNASSSSFVNKTQQKGRVVNIVGSSSSPVVNGKIKIKSTSTHLVEGQLRMIII
ncbi:hypothetical protein CCACVL1_04491 [Corchorus capsularis]|uniref:Uncharacterized protein n=1 Tax=Corchorus capsularis TaxID=210143 RepID=A0A1R3JSA3_COCAP|nr:hypothetical protein CCACVL1_04491 [Corchorus capsularis]